jgi:hypothetical protein
MGPQERQTIPVGNVSGGERLEWVRICRVSAKRRRGKHECLRHIGQAKAPAPQVPRNQQLARNVLASGDAAERSLCATSLMDFEALEKGRDLGPVPLDRREFP